MSLRQPPAWVKKSGSLSPRGWFAIVLVSALLVRLGMLLVYQPVRYSDTPSYYRLAESVANGFERYDGTRMPGYPAFLALAKTDQTAWYVQLGMGVVISLALFYVGWQLSGMAWVGGIAGLLHSLNLGQLFFESALLTETLTSLWLALFFAGLVYAMKEPERKHTALCAATGLAVSLALLTRPLFIYLPVLALPFLVLHLRQADATGGRLLLVGGWVTRLAAFLLPVILLTGGWVTFIHARYGDWALTTMTGYHLVQHTGSFFEYVPDEYAGLRDTYLRYREAHIAATGTQTNTIWEAIPDLQAVSGLNFYDLSRSLARISVQLILEHPGLYLKNVLEGWWLFWRAPVYWQPEAVGYAGLVPVLSALIWLQRVALTALNLVFVLASLVWVGANLFTRRLRKRFSTASLSLLFLAGNLWTASVVQSLLDHGDNPRFLVPMQSFVLIWLLMAGVIGFIERREAQTLMEMDLVG